MGPSSGVRDVCIEHTLGFFLIATKKVSQPRNRLTSTNQVVVYKGLRATQRFVPPAIAVIRLEFSLPVTDDLRLIFPIRKLIVVGLYYLFFPLPNALFLHQNTDSLRPLPIIFFSSQFQYLMK